MSQVQDGDNEDVSPGVTVVFFRYSQSSQAASLIGRVDISCFMNKETEVAEVLIDIEAQLRQLGQWQKVEPSEEALASEQPFCVDTLTLPQWLQFVFLPTLYRMLEEEEQLPARCGIAPMAEEYFRGTGLACAELVSALLKVDELLSTDPGPGERLQ